MKRFCSIIMLDRRLLKKLYYAFLLVRRGGIGVLVRLFCSRVNSTITYVWLAKDLDSGEASDSSQIPYSLQSASPEAFRRILARLNGESGQDVFEILRRVSFYERGFDTCYLVSTESGDVCHVVWLLSASHNDLIRTQYPSGMCKLEKDEVLLENIFTFPSYRSKGIMTSVTSDLANLAREQGFHRVLAYVDIENKTSLKAFLRAGFYYCGEELENRRFFRIWRSGQSGK